MRAMKEEVNKEENKRVKELMSERRNGRTNKVEIKWNEETENDQS